MVRLYVFLWFSGSLCIASSKDEAHIFYKDVKACALRSHMLKSSSRGPIRELDAYLSYISEVAYLGSPRSSKRSTDKLRNEMLCKVYLGQYHFHNARIKDVAPLLAHMEEPRGRHVVESVIDCAFQELMRQELTKPELEMYVALKGMMQHLADSLSDVQQRRFWQAWLRRVAPLTDKEIVFDESQNVKLFIKAPREKLLNYVETIEQILKAQTISDISRSEKR